MQPEKKPEKKPSIGIWLNKRKDSDEVYLSGTMDDKKITIYKNNYKVAGDKQPDYKMYIHDIIKKEDGIPAAAAKQNDFPF